MLGKCVAMRSAGWSFLRRKEHSDSLPRKFPDGVVMDDVFSGDFSCKIRTFSTRGVCAKDGDEKNAQLMD